MAEHQGNIDQIHQIQLASSIQQVMWTRPMVVVDGTVGLEVFTHYVGNGAELDIELADLSGKKFGTFKDKISGNRFWANIVVPNDAKDALFATVKLNLHGLTQQSPPLILLPPIEIKNAQWDKQEARRGDILTLTADVQGDPDGTEAEIVILEHDADGAHDFITKFPVLVSGQKVEMEWEYEYHEDIGDIPTAEESEKGYNPPEYFFRVSIQGVSTESELLQFKDWIKFEAADAVGNPLKDLDYTLYLADGSERKGKLDATGTVVIEDIPPGPYNLEFPTISED